MKRKQLLGAVALVGVMLIALPAYGVDAEFGVEFDYDEHSGAPGSTSTESVEVDPELVGLDCLLTVTSTNDPPSLWIGNSLTVGPVFLSGVEDASDAMRTDSGRIVLESTTLDFVLTFGEKGHTSLKVVATLTECKPEEVEEDEETTTTTLPEDTTTSTTTPTTTPSTQPPTTQPETSETLPFTGIEDTGILAKLGLSTAALGALILAAVRMKREGASF